MTSETNRTGDEHFLDELDDARLRQAVELVRGNSAPDEAMNTALARPESIAAVAASVRRQPTTLKPARRRLAKMVVAVGVIWVIAAGIWTAQSIEEENGKYVADASRSVVSEMPIDKLGRDAAADEGIRTDTFYDWQPTARQLSGSSQDYTAINGVWGLFDENTRRIRDTLDGLGNGNTWMTRRDGRSQELETVAFSQDGRAIAQSQKKIIKSANVSLVVKELAKAETDLNGLVQKHHAEIANAQVAQNQGQQRAARWIIRVQADSLEALLKDIAGLGIAEARSINANDVTEEYIDLESRIASKKKLEQRILDVLEKKAGDIKDVLAVEEQLARIRTEIESMEGRRKYLDNMTAMSTVSVLAREQADYIPPEVDSFTNQVNHAWSGSLDVIKNFGKSLVLVAVASGPWLPIAVVLCFVVFRMFKRRRALKRMKAEG